MYQDRLTVMRQDSLQASEQCYLSLVSLIPRVSCSCRQVQDKVSDITTQAQVKAQEIGHNVSICPCCSPACNLIGSDAAIRTFLHVCICLQGCMISKKCFPVLSDQGSVLLLLLLAACCSLARAQVGRLLCHLAYYSNHADCAVLLV